MSEVLINTHHLARQVRLWAAGQDSKVKIRLVNETELLGSAGRLRQNWDFVRNEECFGILYADNLVRFDFNGLLAFHRAHSDCLTIAAFEAEHPEQCGILSLDLKGRLVKFVEKPSRPNSNLANAG